MTERIFIKRDNTEIPFGFKLQGGTDFAVPLSILHVTPNSIADLAGLKAGDAILKINDADTFPMEHSRAKMEMIRAGNDMWLTIRRNAVDPSKPAFTPLSELKTNKPIVNYAPPPPARKTDLTIQKEDTIKIGSSHNRAPMPFNRGVGTTIDYKAAKPSNWSDGDYTKWANEPSSPKPVLSNQYNSPVGLYSNESAYQAYQNQVQPEFYQPTQTFQSNQAYRVPQQPSKPRGIDSLSMRMLNAGIEQSQGTDQPPPSIFDLRNGNPTGATVPRGFKSVQAPTELPPEQRHAPMRKVYEVKHVKQDWIEPKIN